MSWLCDALELNELTLYFMNGYTNPKETEESVEFRVNPIHKVDRVKVERTETGYNTTCYEKEEERSYFENVSKEDLPLVLENGTGLAFS